MSFIIGDKKPETISEFVQVVVEALMTVWFQKFNLDMDKLPIAVTEVLVASEDELTSDMALSPSTREPLKLALEISESSVFLGRLCDGTPITTEKLTKEATRLVKIGVRGQFITERVMRAIEEMEEGSE